MSGHPVEANGVVVEERAALLFEETAGELVEARVDLVEACAQPVHREIAGEHGARDTEGVDRGENHLALARHAAESGEFHRDIRAGSEGGHGGFPAGKVFVGRQARVVEDDDGAREIARKTYGFVELAPRGLQLEVQAEGREPGISCTPFRIVHHPGRGLVPHAADEVVSQLRLQYLRAVVVMEPGLRDRHGRERAFVSDFGNEVHFPGGVARVPLCFHVHAAHHVPLRAVRAVVLQAVSALELAVIAVAERDRLGIAEPRVVMRLRVPDVEMRVRDLNQRAASVLASKKCSRWGSTARRALSRTLMRVAGSTRATIRFGPARTSSRISLPSGSTTSTVESNA